MSPCELAEVFDTNPSQPYRLTLSSGDAVIVDNPTRTLIESSTVYIGQADNPLARVAQRTKIVSIPNIAMVEKVDPRSLRNGRRRRH